MTRWLAPGSKKGKWHPGTRTGIVWEGGTNAPDLRVVGAEEGNHEDFVGEYLATLGGRSDSTVDAYERMLRSLAG